MKNRTRTSTLKNEVMKYQANLLPRTDNRTTEYVSSKYWMITVQYGIFGLLTLIVLILLFILLKKYYRRCKEGVEDSNLEEGTFNLNNLESTTQIANSNNATNQLQQSKSADDSDSSSTSSESSTQSVENSSFIQNCNQYSSLKARPKAADNEPDKNSVTTPDYENLLTEKNEDYVNMGETISNEEDPEHCSESRSDDGSVHYSTVVFNKAKK